MLKLIVGLGNPGDAYQDTRHNAGFWFVDALARRHGIQLSYEKKYHGQLGRGKVHGMDVRLLLPDTFMNKSGMAVAPLAKFFDIPADTILVVHDELDIPAGSVKLKTGGGHGGHNGLRDIIPHIGNDFHRLRIGIGRPTGAMDVSSFVLARPMLDERVAIDTAIDAALDGLNWLAKHNLEKARSHINGFKPPPTPK